MYPVGAELAALEEAVRHARSPKDRFVLEVPDRKTSWRFRQGLACYDWWVQSFRVEPDRVPSAGDRYCLGVYRSTRRAAAGFLRELAPKYPRAAEHFKRAVEHFDAEADALDVCRDKLTRGWQGWKKPDRALTARMVGELTRARDVYAKGIEEIERALQLIAPERLASARQPRPVRRKNGRVWLEGVKRLAFGKGRECTFAGAIEEALFATRHPYLYHEIMGLTGLGFRVRWCNEDAKTKWCGSCPIGEMPDEQAAVAKLTSWSLPTEWIGPKTRDTEKLRARIVANIDQGKPVVTYPEGWNMALIYGYEDGGRTVLLNDYAKDEMPSKLPVEKLGPLQTWLGEYHEPPPLRDALREVLRTAVLHWRRHRRDRKGAGLTL